MSKMSQCLFGGALIGAGISCNASANITVNDRFGFLSDPTGTGMGIDYSYAYGTGEIHVVNFIVQSDSNVQLDLLSYFAFDSFVDGQIRLFADDGNPLSYANQVAENDQFFGTDLNGSVSSNDSFLDVFLSAGEYKVAVGSFFFTPGDAEARTGFLAVGSTVDVETAVMGGEYQLDIIGDVDLAVPTPGVLAIFGLGGFVGSRRRR